MTDFNVVYFKKLPTLNYLKVTRMHILVCFMRKKNGQKPWARQEV